MDAKATRIEPCSRLQIKLTLVLNKLDRMILELQLSPEQAYERMKAIITQVNMILSAFESERFISEADAVLASQEATAQAVARFIAPPKKPQILPDILSLRTVRQFRKHRISSHASNVLSILRTLAHDLLLVLERTSHLFCSADMKYEYD